MTDAAHSVALLPDTLDRLTFSAANAIEANLLSLMLHFPVFESEATADALGTLGYLELSETGCPAGAFRIDRVNLLDRLIVTVEGDGAANLSWHGSGWTGTLSGDVLTLTRDFPAPASLADFRAALESLSLTATGNVTATVRLAGEQRSYSHVDGSGSVALRFRSGATWALLESMHLTWDDIETQNMSWTGLEGLRKP